MRVSAGLQRSLRNWIKDAGRHWAELVVLPEGQAAAIRRAAVGACAPPLPPPHYSSASTSRGHWLFIRIFGGPAGQLPVGDSPTILWQRLAVLLKLLSCSTTLCALPILLRRLNESKCSAYNCTSMLTIINACSTGGARRGRLGMISKYCSEGRAQLSCCCPTRRRRKARLGPHGVSCGRSRTFAPRGTWYR